MAAFRKTRPLRQVGRDHLAKCAELVASSPGLITATAMACRILSPADIRRASTSTDDAADLLYAIVEAFLSGSLPGEDVSYVFHASIFTAALDIEPDGHLIEMAGRSAADGLTMMLLMALEHENYEFMLGPASDILDNFGHALGQTYYNAQAAGFRLAAKKRMHRTRSSAMENLDVEPQLEAYRIQLRQLLPVARRDCESEDERKRMLGTLESLL